MSSVKQRTALVTGASSGIGEAIARALVEAGFHVYGTTRQPEKQCETVPWEWVELNLRDDESVAGLRAKIGELDFLVNNAGKAYLSSIIDGDLGQWDEMWEVNVRGLAYLTQSLLPLLRPQGGVINISSLSGHRVPPSGGFYSPTKFAVKALTESLRLELRARDSGIRVGSISPGFVDTPLLNDYFAGRNEELEQMRATTKMLEPEDVAAAVITLVNAGNHVEFGDISLRSTGQTV